MAMAAGAFAQDLPRIAVYVTGDVPENEKTALGTRLLASLINSGRYKGIERSNAFLAEVEKEQVKQRSGAIDDGQISELGRQFGVKFICIANITPAFGEFQVSARVVNVETAEVEFIGESASPLKSMTDLARVSDQVVKNMFGEEAKSAAKAKTEPRPKPEFKISAGGGVLLASGFGGGFEWANKGQKTEMPYLGGGAYLFFDAVYAEAFAGFSTGGGRWESGNAAINAGNPDMPRSYINIGAFAKYPLDIGSVKLFPLLGIDYEAAIAASLKYDDGLEYYFGGGDGNYAASALSAVWFKFGGGADFALGQAMYLRAEALYGMRAANGFEKEEANNNKRIIPASGITLKAGAGINF
jgi:hypothetical protein